MEEMQHAKKQMTRHRSNTATIVQHSIQIQVIGTTGAADSKGDTVVKIYFNDDLIGSSKTHDIVDWNPLAPQQVCPRDIYATHFVLDTISESAPVSFVAQVEANSSSSETYEIEMPSDMLSVAYSLAFEVCAYSRSNACVQIQSVI
jgi:hypothetical protein